MYMNNNMAAVFMPNLHDVILSEHSIALIDQNSHICLFWDHTAVVQMTLHNTDSTRHRQHIFIILRLVHPPLALACSCADFAEPLSKR